MALFRRVKPPFSLKTLQKDSNCIAIQDPSAVWGLQDFLPRRNLLTYSEDFSNAAWTKSNITLTANTNETTDPSGTYTATKLAATGTPNFGSASGSGVATASGIKYVARLRLKTSDATWVLLQVSDVGTTDRTRVWFNLATGAKGTSATTGGGVVVDYGITALSNGWYEVYSNVTNPITSTFIYCYPVTGDGSTTAQQKTWYSMGIMFTRATTTDQSYQRITDWTMEQYAWAAAKQVPWLRRNAASNTVNFDTTNYWTASNATVSPAGLFTCSNTNAAHVFIQKSGTLRLSTVIGQSYTMAAKCKKGTHNYVQLTFTSGTSEFANTSYVNFDLNAGSRGTIGAAITQSGISGPDADGYYTIYATTIATATASNVGCVNIRAASSTSAVYQESWAAAGTETFYIKEPAFFVGGLVGYQEISTTWDATYTANAIAAGYPISLWHDAAGTIAAWESGRAIGAVRDLKYGDYGAKLIGPVDFTTGWTNSNVTAAVDGGTALAVGGGSLWQGQLITGKIYHLAVSGTASASGISITNADSGTSPTLVSFATGYSSQSVIFVAANQYFRVRYSAATPGLVLSGCSILLREIPGYTAIQSTAANQPKWVLDSNGKPYFERATSNVQLTPTFGNEGSCTIYTADNEQTIKESAITINGATPMLQYGRNYGTVVMKGTGLKASSESKLPAKIFNDSAKALVAPADDWTKVGPTYWKNYKQLRSKSAVSTADSLSTPTGSYPTIPRGCVLMADGRVFSVPSDSTTAYAIYNPTTDSLETINDTLPGSTAFIGGVLLLDGRVFCVPSANTSARIYNPATNSMSTPTGTYAGSSSFIAAVLLSDGRVFFVPRNSTSARIYNPTNDTLSTPTGTYPGTAAFAGGVLLADGRVFCVPDTSTSARIYDPVTDTLSTPTGTYPGTSAFSGAVLLSDGRVFCIPNNSTSARIYDPVTDTLSTPTGTYAGSGAFAGGTLLPDGRVFCFPFNSTAGKIYNPFTDTLENASGTYPGSAGLLSGVLLLDGRVYCAPRASSTARIYNGGYPAQPAARVLSAYDNKY